MDKIIKEILHKNSYTLTCKNYLTVGKQLIFFDSECDLCDYISENEIEDYREEKIYTILCGGKELFVCRTLEEIEEYLIRNTR